MPYSIGSQATNRTCPRCAAVFDPGDARRCPSCGYDVSSGSPSPMTSPPRTWDPSRSVPDTAPRQASGTDSRMVGIGAVIAVALVVIAGYLVLSGLRDSKGWGDIICHAKFGDPGFGNVWTRDIDGANVCYPEPW